MNDSIGRTAILVPVYQAQEDFDDSMRCVAASQCKCDVIAVDDGSDPPLQIGSYGHDLCVHLIRLERNGGIVRALNIGVRYALDSGYKYLARLDAGDYPVPARFQKQIDYLDQHPQCMLVGSDVDLRGESGEYLFTIKPPRQPQQLRAALHERVWLMHPSVTFRSSVFEKVGFYSDRYQAAEDYDLFLRITREHEVGVVPETLLTYIVRSTSISGRKVRAQAWSRLRIHSILQRPLL